MTEQDQSRGPPAAGKAHWLLKWSGADHQGEEETFDRDVDLKVRIQNLLLDGVHSASIAIYRSAEWNFEIEAHIKPPKAP